MSIVNSKTIYSPDDRIQIRNRLISEIQAKKLIRARVSEELSISYACLNRWENKERSPRSPECGKIVNFLNKIKKNANFRKNFIK